MKNKINKEVWHSTNTPPDKGPPARNPAEHQNPDEMSLLIIQNKKP
jgi:hypothetical protein